MAYKKFKANQEGATHGKKEVSQMKQRVESTEKENELLKKRLEELERSQQGTTSPAAAPEVIFLESFRTLSFSKKCEALYN